MKLRKLVPKRLRLRYQLVRRYWKYDLLADWRYANGPHWNLDRPQFSIELAIRKSPLYENKVHNLRLASRRISGLLIRPEEVFSFWRTIGPPTARNGFRKGRNLIGGVLLEDYGGGLCQLSGLTYYLALKADLHILERWNHSVDIYDEASRFTPLGTDAAVAYGYKDLQVRNNRPYPIRFGIEVREQSIIGTLHSEGPIEEGRLHFTIREEATGLRVSGYRADGEQINESVYAKPPETDRSNTSIIRT